MVEIVKRVWEAEATAKGKAKVNNSATADHVTIKIRSRMMENRLIFPMMICHFRERNI